MKVDTFRILIITSISLSILSEYTLFLTSRCGNSVNLGFFPQNFWLSAKVERPNFPSLARKEKHLFIKWLLLVLPITHHVCIKAEFPQVDSFFVDEIPSLWNFVNKKSWKSKYLRPLCYISFKSWYNIVVLVISNFFTKAKLF